MDQLVLSSPDFTPPPFEVINNAVAYLHAQVQQKPPVTTYVHCKSGIGRSATVVAAYYMKYYQYSAERAVTWVRSKRTVIFRDTSRQMANLKEYEKYLNANKEKKLNEP